MRTRTSIGLKAVAVATVLLAVELSAALGSPAAGGAWRGTEKASHSVKSEGRNTELTALTTDYLVGIAEQKFEHVATLVDPNVEFDSPGRQIHGAADYIVALKRLAPILA